MKGRKEDWRLPPETAAATRPDAAAATGRIAGVTTARNAVSSGPNGAMISVRDLRKKIDKEEILRGVDLNVAVGETLVIIGRSGGGKSVLLKNLIGLMRAERGEIWIGGQKIMGMRERQRCTILQKIDDLVQNGPILA